MNPKAKALRGRTAAFAAAVIRLCESIPDTQSTRTLKSQLIDAATSVAGNYRATCRARSRAEFVAKVGVVREEADEAYGWLCLLVETGALQRDVAAWHIKEAWELAAIFNASYLTAKRRLTGKKRQEPKSGDDPNPTSNPSIPE